jgi:hypothetical protein
MANTFTKIASVTVGSGGTASIVLTSIPSTYTDLCVKISSRGINNPFLSINFNGSGSNFTNKQVLSEAGTITNLNRTDGFIGYGNVNPNATANTFSNNEIYIPNYAGSNNKSFSVDSTAENNSGSVDWYLGFVAGLWSNSAAITSVSLFGDFTQYSTATLYGIKNS